MQVQRGCRRDFLVGGLSGCPAADSSRFSTRNALAAPAAGHRASGRAVQRKAPSKGGAKALSGKADVGLMYPHCAECPDGGGQNGAW
jgi:hypothetical protein